MKKREWIIYISITVAVFVMGALGILMLVPQIESYSELPETYVEINKGEYTFDDSVNKNTLSKEYDINSKDVSQGLKQDKYDEGNINPFTPNNEVTIYNEPSLNIGNDNNQNDGKPLTPSDK